MFIINKVTFLNKTRAIALLYLIYKHFYNMNHDLLISKVFYTTRIRKTIISKFEANLDKYTNIVYYLKN